MNWGAALNKGEEQHFRNLDALAPQHPFRMTIVGPSGCGKTNMMCELMMKSFSSIY